MRATLARAGFYVAALAMVGTTAGGGEAAAKAATVSVSPRLSRIDQPVHIKVSGVAPRDRVTLTVRSTDANFVPWSSSATYRADAHGRVDLDHAVARAGSYQGRWGSGLVAAMHPARGFTAPAAYYWRRIPNDFSITARVGGRVVARYAFQRRFPSDQLGATVTTDLSSDGFTGQFVAPATPGRHPAVLVIGGSNGGMPGVFGSWELAARGVASLRIAYFKSPGLPDSLAGIKLEYFERALRWLRSRAEVDPSRVSVLGVSRGSEAALLLGVDYPDLVHGVVVGVPSNSAICSYPGCAEAAWTLGGKPIPFTRQFNNPDPTDDPAAVIPVERIRGPILANCAGYDRTWSSCDYARAIIARLDQHHFRYHHELREYPKAGHFVGGNTVYEPFAPGGDAVDEQGREDFWPHLIALLRAPS